MMIQIYTHDITNTLRGLIYVSPLDYYDTNVAMTDNKGVNSFHFESFNSQI